MARTIGIPTGIIRILAVTIREFTRTNGMLNYQNGSQIYQNADQKLLHLAQQQMLTIQGITNVFQLISTFSESDPALSECDNKRTGIDYVIPRTYNEL